MITFERIQVVGSIGSCNIVNGERKSYFKLSLTPGRRMLRGEQRSIWYNILVPKELVRDEKRFLELYRKSRLMAVDGRPIPEAFIDSAGVLKAEITIIVDSLPVLLDPASTGLPSAPAA